MERNSYSQPILHVIPAPSSGSGLLKRERLTYAQTSQSLATKLKNVQESAKTEESARMELVHAEKLSLVPTASIRM
jgi:hypothetical protein